MNSEEMEKKDIVLESTNSRHEAEFEHVRPSSEEQIGAGITDTAEEDIHGKCEKSLRHVVGN